MASIQGAHVSLLATLASPAQHRLDKWHQLERATHRLAGAVASGARAEQ